MQRSEKIQSCLRQTWFCLAACRGWKHQFLRQAATHTLPQCKISQADQTASAWSISHFLKHHHVFALAGWLCWTPGCPTLDHTAQAHLGLSVWGWCSGPALQTIHPAQGSTEHPLARWCQRILATWLPRRRQEFIPNVLLSYQEVNVTVCCQGLTQHQSMLQPLPSQKPALRV